MSWVAQKQFRKLDELQDSSSIQRFLLIPGALHAYCCHAMAEGKQVYFTGERAFPRTVLYVPARANAVFVEVKAVREKLWKNERTAECGVSGVCWFFWISVRPQLSFRRAT